MLFAIAVYRAQVHAQSVIASGSGGNLLFVAGQTLAFQSSTVETIVFTVDSGILNGTTCSFYVYTLSGKISFYSTDNAVLSASVNRVIPVGFSTTGATTIGGGNNSWSITVPTDTTCTFAWYFRAPNPFDEYTTLSFGIIGVVGMIVTPLLMIKRFRDDGLEAETIEFAGIMVILFLIFAGLFYMWLMW